MSDESNPYFIAYKREKQGRQEVEQLLEDSTRQLYEKNQLLEQQIVHIQNQQQSMIQQEKLATLGTLAAGVAHEINNPLAFVTSNMNTLANYTNELLDALTENNHPGIPQHKLTFIAEDLPELMSDTSKGLLRIKDIVRNLLFFARTDSELVADLQLADAVQLALKLLTSKLKNVVLKQHIAAVPTIQFNAGELNQVLINIIVNAIHACEAIPERTAEITVTLSHHAKEIILCIKDNGCGMTKYTLSKLYDAFYTTKPPGSGTGIGMPIVLKILQQHNCSINVQSAVNQGTTVNLHFPVN